MKRSGAQAPDSTNMKVQNNNQYKFKPLGGWDDTVSWCAIAFIFGANILNYLWAFCWT